MKMCQQNFDSFAHVGPICYFQLLAVNKSDRHHYAITICKIVVANCGKFDVKTVRYKAISQSHTQTGDINSLYDVVVCHGQLLCTNKHEQMCQRCLRCFLYSH